jgi:hypothetical protein
MDTGFQLLNVGNQRLLSLHCEKDSRGLNVSGYAKVALEYGRVISHDDLGDCMRQEGLQGGSAVLG